MLGPPPLLCVAAMCRAAFLLALCLAVAAGATTTDTTIEPERPTWPEEFQVPHPLAGALALLDAAHAALLPLLHLLDCRRAQPMQ